MFDFLLLLLFPAVMAFAGAMDLLTMTIPNRVSISLAALFVVLAPLAGFSGTAFIQHLGAGALVLLVCFLMFARGWIGGGDAKLMAAAALWLGFAHLPAFLMQVAILGGVLAVAILAYRQFVPMGALPGPAWALRLHERGRGIPYGVAISGAAMLIYPSTPWFAAFAAS